MKSSRFTAAPDFRGIAAITFRVTDGDAQLTVSYDRILPDLTRTQTATNDPQAIQLVASEAVPQGLAILDAPDRRSWAGQRDRALLTVMYNTGARVSENVVKPPSTPEKTRAR